VKEIPWLKMLGNNTSQGVFCLVECAYYSLWQAVDPLFFQVLRHPFRAQIARVLFTGVGLYLCLIVEVAVVAVLF
jgi:hypothetical protein